MDVHKISCFLLLSHTSPITNVTFGFRDEKELQPTFKIKMLRDGDVCTLQMSGVTLKMSGEYRCVAVNSAGEAVCAANVAVVGESA